MVSTTMEKGTQGAFNVTPENREKKRAILHDMRRRKIRTTGSFKLGYRHFEGGDN